MFTVFGLFIVLAAAAAIPTGVHLGFRAPRVPETGSPGDYGLAYDAVRIPTVRQRHLFGWLLPQPGADCIGFPFETIAPMNSVRRIACPILLVHGTDDQTVPVEDARRILANCRTSQARLLEVDGAGHDSVDKIEQHVSELTRFLNDTCPTK
ncbi:S9 family peptidase [uncultured Lamprocystis sp.]|jgi:pimeloyl-ACP methyl ester carboxylesterase|uniref:alpha/beta hydrolase family protein n=1 Tax=uncultured Lamprocystis sp. TaxID=543132 RepID=UPI0025E3D78C|nr:alpha/beta hydrolase [uncultured Lamprocystis sp.]